MTYHVNNVSIKYENMELCLKYIFISLHLLVVLVPAFSGTCSRSFKITSLLAAHFQFEKLHIFDFRLSNCIVPSEGDKVHFKKHELQNS